MKRASIRLRLTAWYAAILATTFLALGLGIWGAIRRSINNVVDSDLVSRVQRMSEFVGRFKGQDIVIAEEVGEQAALTSSGTALRLMGANGHWIYRSPGTEPWGPMDSDGIAMAVIDGKNFRAITAQVPSGRLQIAVPFDGYDRVLRNFAWTMILGAPLALALASAGGYWMSRRALAPVDRIAELSREISAQRLSERLPVRAAGDELDRLSQTLNEMFERLEEGFRRITQFTADASHELRTPVAIIRTTAEIATSRPRLPEEHLQAWERVIAESERTSLLLSDLMSLARADASVAGPEFEAVNLGEFVQEASRQILPLVEQAGLRLNIMASPACVVFGDAESLRRLCLILLDNAVKYTPRGGSITVRLGAVDDVVTLEIRDTGIGISEEDQPRIFDRFYRVAKDRSRKTGGAGLGLAIAKWIVQKHRGEIEVDSALEAGSTFRVRFSRFSAPSDCARTIEGKEIHAV